jgi:hypothetical protein
MSLPAAARPERTRIWPSVLPAPGDLRRRPRLRIVPTPRRQAPRTPFVILVIAMLAGALLGVLVLNTQRAQNAFTLSALQRQNAKLADQAQALRSQVQNDQTPATLSSRAVALGMVPGTDPLFVDPTGKILGLGTGAGTVVDLSKGERVGDLIVVGKATPRPVDTSAASALEQVPAVTPVATAPAGTAPAVAPTTPAGAASAGAR